MNSSGAFFGVLTTLRQNAVKSFRNFHAVQVLSQRQQLNFLHDNQHDADTSLFFTNMPNKRREKRVKMKKAHLLNPGTLVISCKHKELNHYSGMQYGKFDVIPLASKGWMHRKSRGDYFTILPTHRYSPFFTKEYLPDTFEAYGIHNEIIQQLKKINVTHPTLIQAKAIEKLLTGENVLMFAECGSGKTLGYVIAMIENILQWKDQTPSRVNMPLGIIVTTSRELAVQVLQLASRLGSDLGLNCQALLHGHTRGLLDDPPMTSVDILVCTAPAAIKHLKRQIYSTKYCKHVVIDDADAFEIDQKFEMIQGFLSSCKLQFTGLNDHNGAENSAQICFVSAVAPSSLEGKLNDMIKASDVPVISTPYLHKVLCTVQQRFLRVSSATLPGELLRLTKNNARKKIPTLVFSNSDKACNWAYHFLKEKGVQCVTVNRKDEPCQRLVNFRDFESGFVDILCSTNMLSLGFHFPRVKHVISIEFPRYMTDYIHRCGRVGRLGQPDDCLITNFIRKPKDVELVQQIEKAVRTNSVLPRINCPRVRDRT